MQNSTFILACLLCIPTIACTMDDNKKSCLLPLDQQRVNAYCKYLFEQKKDGPLRKNPDMYKEVFTKQVIAGARTFWDITTKTPSTTTKTTIPAEHTKSICSVLTFLFVNLQSIREQGPETYTVKLKGYEIWRDFFITQLKNLFMDSMDYSEDEFYINVNLDGMGYSAKKGCLILVDSLKKGILPYDCDEILIIPDKNNDLIIIRPNWEKSSGWKARDEKESTLGKFGYGISNPTSLYNGVVSWFSKSTGIGSYLPNDGTIQTEYLDTETAHKITTVLTNLKTSPKTLSIAAVSQHLSEYQGTDDKMKEAVEDLKSYLKKRFKKHQLCIGCETIFDQKYLKACALYYKTLLQQGDEYTTTTQSDNYSTILNEFKKLKNFIFLYNHGINRVSYYQNPMDIDTIWSQALYIVSNKTFKSSLTKNNIPDDAVKQYLYDLIETIICAIQAQKPHSELLEQPFFDEDDLNSIKQNLSTRKKSTDSIYPNPNSNESQD